MWSRKRGTIRDNNRPIAEIGQRWTNLPMSEPTPKAAWAKRNLKIRSKSDHYG